MVVTDAAAKGVEMDIQDISEKDRNAVLHPFTHIKDFATGKFGEPTIVDMGKGIRIKDAHGNQLIDGFAGLYCVNVGYGRTEVAEAISRQAFLAGLLPFLCRPHNGRACDPVRSPRQDGAGQDE